MTRFWVLVVLVACGPAIPPLPSQGGPPWLELTSDHFTLWTDTSVDRARELVGEMERLRQVIVGTAFRSVARDGRIFVVAVRDEVEFNAYNSGNVWAYASSAQNNVLHQVLIVLPAQTQSRADELTDEHTEAHELTHAISFTMIPRQPRWFAEGLAQFFQTISVDSKHGTVDLGRPPERRGQPVRMRHLISLRTLFRCKDCVDAAFYATAWAVFTYLQNVHAEELARFEQLLAANQDWQAAWDTAFPRLPIDTLEEELRVWLTSGSHQVLHFNVRFNDYSVAQRVLGEGDIHAVRALLAPKQEMFAEIEAARRVEPTNVLANLLAVAWQRGVTTDAARAVAAAHPDEWRAWLVAAMVLGSGEEAQAARDNACRLAAGNPAVIPPKGLCEATLAGDPGVK